MRRLALLAGTDVAASTILAAAFGLPAEWVVLLLFYLPAVFGLPVGILLFVVPKLWRTSEGTPRGQRPSTSRAARWLLGLTLCAALSALYGAATPGALASRAGTLAVGGFLCGLAFGARAFLPVYVIVVSTAIAEFVASPWTSDSQAQALLVLLVPTLVPALFAIPTLAGALIRFAVGRGPGRSSAATPPPTGTSGP